MLSRCSLLSPCYRQYWICDCFLRNHLTCYHLAFHLIPPTNHTPPTEETSRTDSTTWTMACWWLDPSNEHFSTCSCHIYNYLAAFPDFTPRDEGYYELSSSSMVLFCSVGFGGLFRQWRQEITTP
jgi:hypothetical protein